MVGARNLCDVAAGAPACPRASGRASRHWIAGGSVDRRASPCCARCRSRRWRWPPAAAEFVARAPAAASEVPWSYPPAVGSHRSVRVRAAHAGPRVAHAARRAAARAGRQPGGDRHRARRAPAAHHRRLAVADRAPGRAGCLALLPCAVGAGSRPGAERVAGDRRSLYLSPRHRARARRRGRARPLGGGTRRRRTGAGRDRCPGGAGSAASAREVLGHWRDSIALWTRVVSVDPGNDVGHYNLAVALAAAGQADAAAEHYRAVLAINPAHGDARRHLDRLDAARLERQANELAGPRAAPGRRRPLPGGPRSRSAPPARAGGAGDGARHARPGARGRAAPPRGRPPRRIRSRCLQYARGVADRKWRCRRSPGRARGRHRRAPQRRHYGAQPGTAPGVHARPPAARADARVPVGGGGGPGDRTGRMRERSTRWPPRSPTSDGWRTLAASTRRPRGLPPNTATTNCPYRSRPGARLTADPGPSDSWFLTSSSCSCLEAELPADHQASRRDEPRRHEVVRFVGRRDRVRSRRRRC